jgi:hypothetical protein
MLICPPSSVFSCGRIPEVYYQLFRLSRDIRPDSPITVPDISLTVQLLLLHGNRANSNASARQQRKAIICGEKPSHKRISSLPECVHSRESDSQQSPCKYPKALLAPSNP